MQKESAEIVFGIEGAKFFYPTKLLVECFEQHPVRYLFMDNEAYQSLMKRDWKGGMKVYWEELLGRAHFAAAASVIRAYRWASGMLTSYESGLFLPFCANFRALIEAAADGYDALGNVASLLASHRGEINKALQLKASRIIVSQELEDQLIHFSHGRRLDKGENAPASHKAKSAADYVKGLEQAKVSELYDCYSQLCQYTHPASHSVAHLCVPDATRGSLILMPGNDDVRVEALANKYAATMLPLLMFAFNPGALVLKVLLYFDAPEFHTEAMKGMDLSGLPSWKKYAAFEMRCSKTLIAELPLSALRFETQRGTSRGRPAAAVLSV